MTRFRPTWTSLAVTLAVSGCASRGNVELLESRLRRQEDQLRTSQSDLDRTRGQLAAATRETDALRTQLAQNGDGSLLPERTQALFQAVGMKFNDLLTGSLDRDGQPGDDELHVVLVPHDAQGATIKLPGALRVQCLEVGGPDPQIPLAEWNYTPDEARALWHSGLFGEGLQLRLNWPRPPRRNQIVVHAELTTADGRRFEATRTVAVTLGDDAANVAERTEPRRLDASDAVRPAATLTAGESAATNDDPSFFRRAPRDKVVPLRGESKSAAAPLDEEPLFSPFEP